MGAISIISARLPDPPASPMSALQTQQIRDYLGVLKDEGLVGLFKRSRKLSAVRQFYRFLFIEGLRKDDPASDISAAKKAHALPKTLSGR